MVEFRKRRIVFFFMVAPEDLVTSERGSVQASRSAFEPQAEEASALLSRQTRNYRELREDYERNRCGRDWE